MRGVGIDLCQPSILDGCNNPASGNAHGAVGVKLVYGHGRNYDCIIWKTLTTTKNLTQPSRKQKQPQAKAEYLAQRRKDPSAAQPQPNRKTGTHHRERRVRRDFLFQSLFL
jgi:hypothetical protein